MISYYSYFVDKEDWRKVMKDDRILARQGILLECSVNGWAPIIPGANGGTASPNEKHVRFIPAGSVVHGVSATGNTPVIFLNHSPKVRGLRHVIIGNMVAYGERLFIEAVPPYDRS